MEKITKEEFNKIVNKNGRTLHRIIFVIGNLKIDEGLKIEKEEWTIKKHPHSYISVTSHLKGKKFKIRTLNNNGGYAFLRIK